MTLACAAVGRAQPARVSWMATRNGPSQYVRGVSSSSVQLRFILIRPTALHTHPSNCALYSSVQLRFILIRPTLQGQAHLDSGSSSSVFLRSVLIIRVFLFRYFFSIFLLRWLSFPVFLSSETFFSICCNLLFGEIGSSSRLPCICSERFFKVIIFAQKVRSNFHFYNLITIEIFIFKNVIWLNLDLVGVYRNIQFAPICCSVAGTTCPG